MPLSKAQKNGIHPMNRSPISDEIADNTVYVEEQ